MFYSFACTGVRFLLWLLTRCVVSGLENVPSDGPFLLVSNHLSMLDPPCLGALLPRRIAFMAKEEAFRDPLLGPIVKWYGAFAVKRGQADRQALRTAIAILKSGGVVGMFPEGHRSKTGRLNKAYAGSALVAHMAEVPILPVAISGTERIKSPLSLLSRPAVTLRVGEPFTLERNEGGRGNLEAMTAEMMRRIAELLPEERRGFYGDNVSAQ
jgi:1-acyl-sn-glycerol-3-phosphate acyltransferase